MRCETCQGAGMVSGLWPEWMRGPCSDCNGTGIAHCCDGLREQPEHVESPRNRDQGPTNTQARQETMEAQARARQPGAGEA